jgi:uncharacterized membrane protein
MAKPYIEPSYRHSQGSSYTLTWLLSALLVVVFALGLAVYPPMFGPIKAQGVPHMVLFFGRFHPLIVHLPIGVLLLTFLVELGCLRRSVEEKWGDAALLAIFLSAVGAVISVIFGIMLTREGGYEGGAFKLHQGLGIGAAVGCIVALFLRLSAMSSGGRGLMEAYRFFLLLTFGVLSIGAHFGGNMVHGSKYLIQYAPDWIAQPVSNSEKWLVNLVENKKPIPVEEPGHTEETPAAPAEVKPTVAATSSDSKQAVVAASNPAANGAAIAAAGGGSLVFDNLILPILEAKCNKCHNADKSKGDLRMDTFEMLMKGGQDDKVKSVVPGKPDDSLVLKRIALPNDEDEHMPPDGKDQTTKEETALLKWWIQEGASNTLTIADAKIPAELQATADTYLKK